MELDVAHAIVLGPGEGEIAVDKPQRTTRIKVGLDAITVTEMRHEAGERGPEAHVHHRHTDAFYVLEGTVTFDLGPHRERIDAPAGAFVAAPPRVVHAFRNASSGRTRLLNIHAPSERFHEYAMRDGEDASWFDQTDPPADGGRPLSDAVVLGPGEGELIEVGTSRVLVKGTGDNTDGHVFLSETTIEPGFAGPPSHVHRELHDLFYVLEGTLTLRNGENAISAEPRTFACFPPGAVHTFSNADGDAPVGFLNFNTPAGWENYLRELGTAFAHDRTPTHEELGRLALRYDFQRV